ncbi:hypothetical protein RHSIM_RhsimUnG0059900 [Rhododendron simsii]|uniref:Uncharacterized protein n=1 Tax=Rhododendron simsii TaxID=118357 RepID=A0A834L4U3_RHOSS|nr:hypothetical protein RHSIM_RhsimUnG0059900 [Rhododendron simsii]
MLVHRQVVLLDGYVGRLFKIRIGEAVACSGGAVAGCSGKGDAAKEAATSNGSVAAKDIVNIERNASRKLPFHIDRHGMNSFLPFPKEGNLAKGLLPKADDHKSLGTVNGADHHGVSDSNTDRSDGVAASQNRLDVNIPKESTAQEPVQTTSSTTVRGNTENYPFKLGKIIVVQAFEAALALMIFRFQPQGVDSSPALSSFMFTMVGVTVLFGFTFTLIGLMLQKAHPVVATVSSHAGSISAVLGFFFMMAVFVPERYVWSFCASAGVLSMVYVYSLAKPSHNTYSSTPFSLSNCFP